ncbi:tyrosine-type recombinase/integrase [Nonomuraea angiospora]|uniref:Integrase n=1 Tax=Nonomuraea angiospora TaxID=46172 RepID=A0ABR9LTR0_9ACTN|nr:tyrosine-type recombinase/integrase [Nonomuraea angiospora]MBE1584027.1 integrase [Nonomuraea angiospora]
MAAWRGVRLCKPHQRQWSVVEGRPDLASWAAKADPVWTAMDEVPLSGLELSVRRQVLVGYQEQLRAGGRLSPHQVKSAIIWLRVHRVDDLLEADLPERGTTTTYLRVWKRALLRLADSPEKARRSTVIRLGTLNPRLKGYVHLTDIQAPWLVHLAQEQAWALAAAGASSTRVRQACYALRWFAYYLRLHHPDQGRTARSVGRVGVMGFLEWFAERARDSEDYQHMDETNPRRAMIAERMLPSLADPTRILLVTAQLHWHYVRALKDAFDRHRQWLHEQGAGDLHVTDEEVPPWPEKDRGFSEEEGRSEDALPETVYLQLLREEALALLTPGAPRNLVELQARIGRRPWEIFNLPFDCLNFDTITVERADGTFEDRTYPFLTYWMQKTRRRHVLPLHDTDAAVIQRQQDYLRCTYPEWFDDEGRPQHPEMMLFPTPRRTRANQFGTRPHESSAVGYWLAAWMQALPEMLDEDGAPFDRRRVFAYAFRHTYAQLRADAGVPLDVLQVLMGHELPSTTQVYYRVSHRRRVEAVHDIAARFRFDLSGDRIRSQTRAESDAARHRAGVGSVPVPGGSCHEMNNVRADGKGCPVFYRCFSCHFFSTDFTQLPQLRELRQAKAEHLARLQASYGTILRAGPLTDANLRLLAEEIAQLDTLISKCEADLTSLTDDERHQVEQWLTARDRYTTLIPVEALKARQQRLDQATFDPITLDAQARGA